MKRRISDDKIEEIMVKTESLIETIENEIHVLRPDLNEKDLIEKTFSFTSRLLDKYKEFKMNGSGKDS